MVGRTIAHYEVTAKIGEGGMGVVYRARDTKLGRDVALKVLPEQFARDPQRMGRFSREARLLASLNHPNIASIYGLEVQDGIHALVMELVEGPTLADRIAEGAIPLDEALPLAQQMAEALEYAHEHSVIHRDLKPANVKVTEEGVVKVLDFGLAKAMEDEAATGDPADSPTLTLGATKAGVILGTAAYMAPEQARAKRVDKRADIWAFGVVLYEMLTGKRLFGGEDLTETLASVVKEQPDLSAVPPKVRRLLQRCLEKDPKKRLRDISVAWELLEEEVPVQAPARRSRLPWAVAAVLFVAAAVFATLWLREPAAEVLQARFVMEPPEGTEFVDPRRSAAVSPDGHYLVFAAEGEGTQSLWLRQLESLTSRQLPGTESRGNYFPFWSPDSKSVAFFADGKLKRIDIAGGAPQELCGGSNHAGSGTWSHDGIILFGSGEGLFRVPASGGVPEQLTTPDAPREGRHVHPQFLPDGRRFLYFVWSTDPNTQGIYSGSLDNPTQRVRIVSTQSKAYYAPSHGGQSGYLLWMRGQTLLAQPFNAAKLRLEGEPTRLAEEVFVPPGGSVSASFWVSDTGVLLYGTGSFSDDTTLTWFDREGNVTGTAGEPHPYMELDLSPDGSRVAAYRGDELGQDLWLIEFARPGQDTRLTTDPANESYPVWSPDGKQIIFGSNRDTSYFDLYRKPASVLGEEELLLKIDERKVPLDWSSEKPLLLYLVRGGATGQDLWVLPLEGDPEPEPYLVTEFNEANAQFSPDGRWVVYTSDRSGQTEVYVSPYPFPTSPDGDPMIQISTGGGAQPRWPRDGKELFYLSPDNTLMAVGVTTEPSFKAGVPSALFEAPIPPGVAQWPEAWAWDVTPDGERFLINTPSEEARSASLTVWVNWQAGLEQ